MAIFIKPRLIFKKLIFIESRNYRKKFKNPKKWILKKWVIKK